MKKQTSFQKLNLCLIQVTILILFSFLSAQNGAWIEQVLQPTMSGSWLADRGENCLGYTKENSQYIYFFDINISQWTEVDLGTPQTFRDLEAAGQTVFAYTDEMIIGYSAIVSQWDTVYYQGAILNTTGPGILRSYGCGEKLAYFVTNSYFYVFDSELGAWQSYDYQYPGAAVGGNYWSGDDYAGAIIHQNPPNYPLNMAYSLPQHAFQENLMGGYYYHTDWGMNHGFVTNWGDALGTYILTGYCSQTNQFKSRTLVPPNGTYEGGNCLFPDNFTQKTVAVFHYLETQSQARLLAYDTQQGNWYEATHYFDPQYYSGLAWWHLGGRAAGTFQYNSQTREQTYITFNGATGGYNTLTPGIYYCGSISGFAGAGGNYIVAYDTNKVWFYNPANQNSQYADMPWHYPTGYYLGNNFATVGSYDGPGAAPAKMHIYNADNNQITNITTGNTSNIAVEGSPYMCGFTAGVGHNEVYFYSGMMDDYQLISYPPNSYPSIVVDDQLAVANTGTQAYLYDATTNSVYSLAYPLSFYQIGKEIAMLHKSMYSFDAYSIPFQQLTEFSIPEGINAGAIGEYIGLVGNAGLTKYYAYNGFYNNLVPLDPAGMFQSHLVGDKTAIVIRVDRIYAFDPQAPTGIEPQKIQPQKYYLSQNYPNPFNPTTAIKFQLSTNNHVILKIYDVLGREVATLVNKRLLAGNHKVVWDARDFPSGLYFCTIKAGEVFTQTKKMLLIK